MKSIYINDIEVGMVLQDNRKSRFVVIETRLNGDDEYYSYLKVIPEDIYVNNKGKMVSEQELRNVIDRIESYEFDRDYIVCDDIVEVQKAYLF